MSLATVLADLGLSQRDTARALGVSQPTVNRIVGGRWPAKGAAQVRRALDALLRAKGANPAQLLALYAAPAPKEVGPDVVEHVEADPPVTLVTEPQGEDPMLLQNAAPTPQAREHFKLPRNPFVNDVESPDDVYQTPNVRYVRAALRDAALHNGLIAVWGESGAGKSTLAEEMEERLRAETRRPVIVIRPHIIGMEPHESKGKTVRVGVITDAIARTLSPETTLKSSHDARQDQVKQMLIASVRAGNAHLVLVEEAHRLPMPTLKHLKGLWEIKDGMRRLLGVALIGQPELAERLASPNPAIREITQRFEPVELGPLDAADLEGYLRLKFDRVGVKYEDVMAPDAVDAILAKLVHLPRGAKPDTARSICYPLVINNLVCRAMNEAALHRWPQVDAQVIAGC